MSVEQVFITSPNGKTNVVSLDASINTVGDLKKQLPDYNRLKLSKGTTPLCDHQSLGDAEVKNGDTLFASPSLPGGGCACRCTCNIL